MVEVNWGCPLSILSLGGYKVLITVLIKVLFVDTTIFLLRDINATTEYYKF